MKLEFTIEEVNQVLGVLGKIPYEQSFQLIAKIQQQAQSQVDIETKDSGELKAVKN